MALEWELPTTRALRIFTNVFLTLKKATTLIGINLLGLMNTFFVSPWKIGRSGEDGKQRSMPVKSASKPTPPCLKIEPDTKSSRKYSRPPCRPARKRFSAKGSFLQSQTRTFHPA